MFETTLHVFGEEIPVQFLLVGGLAGVAAVAMITGVVALIASKREAGAMKRRLAGDTARDELRDGAGLQDSLERLGKTVSSGKVSRGLRQQLAEAGYHGASAAPLYLGAKTALLVIGLCLGVALALWVSLPFSAEAFLVALLSVGPFFAPNFVVRARRARRQEEINRHLPDVVDLLEITVSSGMGLDTAWTAVTDEIRKVSATMAEEMELTSLEISLGVARTVAMRHMAERTGADDISSLVALLVQSERFGSSITESLRVFARSMRETQSKRAEESAEKMAVKLLFPMVLFIFPALLIVMVGPAVMNIIEVMA